MIIKAALRLENNQPGNTWYSNSDHPTEADLQVHMDESIYEALGKHDMIEITIEGKGKVRLH